jgi:predicted dehydrogenase
MNYVRAADQAGNCHVVQIVDRAKLDGPLHRWFDLVDAVVVAVHPRDAVSIAEMCLAHGKPTLIEKPAGLSLADAERLAGAEARWESFVLVGHQHLHSARMESLRRSAEKQLRVRGEAIFGGPGPQRDYSALWDYGPHAVSAALALLGPEGIVATRAQHGRFIIAGPRGHVVARVGNDWPKKFARVVSLGDGHYDGYAQVLTPALTLQVRAFARAVADRATTVDWRFGARWAVDVARLLEAAGGGPAR